MCDAMNVNDMFVSSCRNKINLDHIYRDAIQVENIWIYDYDSIIVERNDMFSMFPVYNRQDWIELNWNENQWIIDLAHTVLARFLFSIEW